LRNEAVEEVEKVKEMCLLKRKEKSVKFLKRRLYEQYRIFSGKYPDFLTIRPINPILDGGSGDGLSLPE